VSKHTPGPWSYKNTPSAGLEIYGDVGALLDDAFADSLMIWGFTKQEPKFLISFERWVQFPKSEWDEMQKANAHLVAAAPELLEALEEMVSVAESQKWNNAEFHTARAVIAKANGNKEIK